MASESKIEQVSVPLADVTKTNVSAYSLPESSSHAEMISGKMNEQVDKLVALLKEKGVIS